MLLRALVLVRPQSLYDRVAEILGDAGVHVTPGEGGGSLWNELERGGFDMVVATSAEIPAPWSSALERLRRSQDQTELIALAPTERPSERAALQAAGAFAVLHSDLGAPDLAAGFGAVLSRFREVAVSRLRSLQQQDSRVTEPEWQSPAMRKLLQLAGRVAASDTTLLLLGETGVGKEWLARTIHAGGPRSKAEFVPMNCAAVPDALIESELFGHEAGAFTGAVRARRGAFEVAHGGTLLLDEIGDLPILLQGKLLRALQERRIQRLGAERPVDVDVRIIAATNRDLQAAMEQGTFRRDLFYRLSVVTLHVPPLRERREDIRPLANSYLDYFRSRMGRPRLKGFDEESLAALESNPWPGNVRELVNTVERAVLLSDGEWIGAQALLEAGPGTRSEAAHGPPQLPTASQTVTGASLPTARRHLVESFERGYLDHALRLYRGHLGDTARAAGIDARTLFNKMRRYGLDREDYRSLPVR